MDTPDLDSIDPPPKSKYSPSNKQRRPRNTAYAVGVALYLVVVVLWTASGFVTQILYRSGYSKPFLVTYMTTSPLALYLIPDGLQWLRKSRTRSRLGIATGSDRQAVEQYQPLATSEPPGELESAHVPHTMEVAERISPLSVQQTAEIAFAFCWLWFIANWAVNASLGYTTVANTTIMSSTSGFFTLGIGQMFRVERLTVLKIAAVFISFLGVVLVSLSDSQPTNPATLISRPDIIVDHQPLPFLGETLALISALFFALYVIFLKVKVRDESRIDMRVFLGFVGLFNMLTCWPAGLLLHWTGMELFGLPSKAEQWYALLTNTAIFAISDYLYVLAVLKTAPLLVTVGISLTIPLSVLGDFILNAPVQGQIIVGAALVFLSFVAIGLDQTNTEDVGPKKQSEGELSRTFD